MSGRDAAPRELLEGDWSFPDEVVRRRQAEGIFFRADVSAVFLQKDVYWLIKDVLASKVLVLK
jgi:hypothetical protein